MEIVRIYITLIFVLVITNINQAQTCCTAGAPLSNNFSNNTTEIYPLEISVQSTFRSINRLVENDEVLVNDPRSRFNLHNNLRFAYRLHDFFSLGLSVPYIFQQRETISMREESFGFGDPVLNFQFSPPISKKIDLYLFSGIKFPLGSYQKTNAIGIQLSPDMQSGTGTWDFINRLAIFHPRFLINNLNVQYALSYRYNSTNKNFNNSIAARSFQFGQEWNTSLLFQYELFSKNSIWVPDLELQYRWQDANNEQNLEAPNSGGHWFNIKAGLTAILSEQNLLRIYVGMPVFQSLEGLQITTNFESGISYSRKIKFKQSLSDKIEVL